MAKIPFSVFRLNKQPSHENYIKGDEVNYKPIERLEKTTCGVVYKNVIRENPLQTLFFKVSEPVHPVWSSFFEDESGNTFNFGDTRVAQAALIVSVGEKDYAVCFGYGRFLLEDSAIERDFGRDAMRGLIKGDNFCSLEYNNYFGVTRNTNVKMSRQTSMGSYGVDTLSSHLRGMAGKTTDFGNATVSGKDALTTSYQLTPDNVEDLIARIENAVIVGKDVSMFQWIDRIVSITKQETIDKLWQLVNSCVIGGDAPCSVNYLDLSQPEDAIGFYVKSKSHGAESGSETYMEIDTDLIRQFAEEGLENAHVHVTYEDREGRERLQNYLCGEIKYDEKDYILDNGEWYLLKDSFAEQIENEYQKTEIFESVTFPVYDRESLKAAHHEALGDAALKEGTKAAPLPYEKWYNDLVAERLGVAEAVSLDRKLEKSSGFEVCDLFLPNTFVHVKCADDSATLSHLFNQGVNSSRMFVEDDKFRDRLQNMVKNVVGEKPLIPAECTVVFAIIPKNKKVSQVNGLPMIPIFSKLAFLKAKREIEGMGFKVKLLHVDNAKEESGKLIDTC